MMRDAMTVTVTLKLFLTQEELDHHEPCEYSHDQSAQNPLSTFSVCACLVVPVIIDTHQEQLAVKPRSSRSSPVFENPLLWFKHVLFHLQLFLVIPVRR